MNDDPGTNRAEKRKWWPLAMATWFLAYGLSVLVAFKFPPPTFALGGLAILVLVIMNV